MEYFFDYNCLSINWVRLNFGLVYLGKINLYIGVYGFDIGILYI